MKFRVFSIFAGIAQTIGMLVLYYFIGFILRTLIPDGILSFELIGVGSVVWIVGCIVIGLAYPVYLFTRKQKADGLVVLLSNIATMGIALLVAFVMISEIRVMMSVGWI